MNDTTADYFGYGYGNLSIPQQKPTLTTPPSPFHIQPTYPAYPYPYPPPAPRTSGFSDPTELAVFISGVLLSVGGCFALVSSHLRKSNCTKVRVAGMECTRDNMRISDGV